jgi:hypothetical protein
MWLPQIILAITSGYVAAGGLFGGWFVFMGVARLDANAYTAPIGFRILIFPGAIALWPVLLVKLTTMARRKA